MDDFTTQCVPPSSTLIHYDARVAIHGLVAAAQHNGAYGRIFDHDIDTGRYDVQIYKYEVDATDAQKATERVPGELALLRIKRHSNVRLIIDPVADT